MTDSKGSLDAITNKTLTCMKPLQLDGLIYNKDLVQKMINEMISLRDGALKENEFGMAVFFSHVIAVLNHCLNNLEQ